MRFRISILLLILFMTQIALKSQTDFDKALTLDFETIGVSRCNENSEAYSNIYGQITLTNQTDTITSFWIRNCSWTDLIKIEPDSILLQVKECDANYTKKILLKKDQSLKLNSIIEIPSDYFENSLDKIRNKDLYNSFRIGFLIIKENEFKRGQMSLSDLINEKGQKNENYIWSQPIKIEYEKYNWKIE